MKKVSIISTLLIFMVVFTVSANATGLREDFKKFEIEKVDNLYLGKKVDQVWTIAYGENEKPVTVVKRHTFDGVEYMVHSQYFEVCYASTSTGFGVRKAKKSWCDVPKSITNAVINQNQLQNQEIITPNKVDDEKALGLIACYLPELLNDGYTHLLN